MRRLFLTLSALFLLTIYSRGDEIVIFDAKTKKSEYITRVEIPDGGFMFRVDFTSINCDSLELNFGYSKFERPKYLDTIPNSKQILPIILDKTKNSYEYQGATFSDFEVNLEHNGKFLWLEILDNPACTSGQVIFKI
jgi:hypothetical protein